MKSRLRIQQDFASGFEFNLFFVQYGVNNEGKKIMYTAEPLVLEEHENHVASMPIASLDDGGAQELMNDLWGCGVRPSDRLIDKTSMKHVEKEVEWHREVIDHLIKRTK
jgi:hypothetical protein